MYTLANEETYSNGETIFKESSPGDWVYIIISGEVEISRVIGNKKYILKKLKAGDVFGEMAFLGDAKRTASAIAVGDTIVGIIDRDSLDTEFNKLSSGFRSILKTLVVRFRSMNDRVSELKSRKDSRLKKTLSLSYKDKESFLNAYTANISKGGLFIKTDKPLPEGENLNLKLRLPELKEPLNINCLVVWVNKKKPGTDMPSGMGLQFLDMNENIRMTLFKYIKAIINK